MAGNRARLGASIPEAIDDITATEIERCEIGYSAYPYGDDPADHAWRYLPLLGSMAGGSAACSTTTGAVP